MKKNNFRTYNLAVEFFKATQKLHVKSFLRNQLDRAASSIALNLREGNARISTVDRKHFFNIAYASADECIAILELANAHSEIQEQLDILCRHICRLIQNAK